jgi:hypothetical protein
LNGDWLGHRLGAYNCRGNCHEIVNLWVEHMDRPMIALSAGMERHFGRTIKLTFCALIFLVAGCQPTTRDLRQEVDKGIGGYLGPVTAFNVPVLLRYQGPSSVTVDTNWSASSSEGKTTSGSLRMNVSVQPIGEQRIWELRATESTTEGRVQRSLSPPLMLARGLSSPRGPLREVDMEFPAYTPQQIRDGIDKNPGVREQLLHRLKFSQMELPERALSNGDDFISSRDYLKTMLTLEFGEQPVWAEMSNSSFVRSNTLSLKVVGQTWRGGRQMLVIKIDGSASLGRDAPILEFSTRGHWLIDIKTGLTGAYLFANELRILRDGKTITSESFMRSESGF